MRYILRLAAGFLILFDPNGVPIVKQCVKVAVAQAGSILGDTAATLDKLERITAEASQNGARLILFPEVFVGGYPRGEDFGAVLGSRTARGRDAFRKYWEGAIDVPGPDVDESLRSPAPTL